jgi:CDP-diacylglycerol---glycerol-3-phosphate 3-phosphatidyltransferase
MHTLPNCLTYLRLALIPVLVAVFYHYGPLEPWPAAAVFVVAGLTDWLDGWLARRLNQTSAFGAFLDPVADKLMVATVLILLVERHASVWIALPTVLIVAREIAVSALREWAAVRGAAGSIPVSWLGKLKTTTQMLALLLLLLGGEVLQVDLHALGLIVLWLAAGLTLWSLLDYLRLALKHA